MGAYLSAHYIYLDTIMSNPRYIINTNDNSASLDIFIGNEFITSYWYENNAVTLSARLNTDVVTLDQFDLNLAGIENWAELIRKYLNSNSMKRKPFDEEIKKKDDKLDAKFISDGTEVSKIKFKVNDGTISFDPRIEVILNITDFRSWMIYLRRVYIEIKNF